MQCSKAGLKFTSPLIQATMEIFFEHQKFFMDDKKQVSIMVLWCAGREIVY